MPFDSTQLVVEYVDNSEYITLKTKQTCDCRMQT